MGILLRHMLEANNGVVLQLLVLLSHNKRNHSDYTASPKKGKWKQRIQCAHSFTCLVGYV
ncbi:hypothetical protein L3i20_v223150 [Paenibacillus sp. L3-i20]|nr:hypothetical protein L3i20_v223150 [Paenibacillus sp. L3-i20]